MEAVTEVVIETESEMQIQIVRPNVVWLLGLIPSVAEWAHFTLFGVL